MPRSGPRAPSGSVRAVIDTNVLVAALLWNGPPHTLLAEARAGRLSLVSSPALLAELADVLGRPKFARILAAAGLSVDEMLDQVRRLVDVVVPIPLPARVCRDPDDDEVLALARTARVDLIVSGDADLLVLEAFDGMPIMDVARALQISTVRR